MYSRKVVALPGGVLSITSLVSQILETSRLCGHLLTIFSTPRSLPHLVERHRSFSKVSMCFLAAIAELGDEEKRLLFVDINPSMPAEVRKEQPLKHRMYASCLPAD